MRDRLLKRQEVLEKTGFCYASLWKWMREGSFPRSVRIGSSVRWRESEVDDWINRQPRSVLKGDEAA